MAEKDNTFQNTVEALFRGMDSFITTKTVVGEAIHIDDTILLPLVDVSFGVGAGAFAEKFLRAPFLSSAKTERVWSTSKTRMLSPKSLTWLRI